VVISSLMWAMTSSASRMTGVRYVSARLKALIVRSCISWTEFGVRAMMVWSPWVPHRACMMSPWPGLVACPVLGPARWMLMITHGVSVMMA